MDERIKGQLGEILNLARVVGHLDSTLRELADDRGSEDGLRAMPDRSRAFRKERNASLALERVIKDLKASERLLNEGVEVVSR